MENFEYHTPTRLIFGKGIIDRLPEVMRPIGNKVLLAYGGGSIKRLGLYDKVKEPLKNIRRGKHQTPWALRQGEGTAQEF